MPLNYKQRLLGQEQLTDELLAGRDIPGEISRTRSRVEAGRGRFLGDALTDVLGSVSQASNVRAIASPYVGGLESGLDVNLAQKRFMAKRNQMAVLQERVADMLERAGYDRRQAEAYAVQYVNDLISRRNIETESAKNRDTSLRLAQAGEPFAARGADIENQSQSDSGVAAALARVLAGGITTAGTLGAFNGKQSNDYPFPQMPIPGSGNTLRERSGFVNRRAY